MAKVQAGRYTSDLFGAEDEFVAFLIGMRVNKPWKLAQWWPVLTAMPLRDSAGARIGARSIDEPVVPVP